MKRLILLSLLIAVAALLLVSIPVYYPPRDAGPARDIPSGTDWSSGFTNTKGGAGGEIVRVTSLDPSGPGSLRDALERSGPRIVVFEVGGVIDLDRTSLRITEPYVTVAGQTAPSPGITIIEGGISIVTHDVIVQHLRVRPGEAGEAKQSGWEVDGIATAGGAHDVVVDHCSISWSTDENLSASGPRFAGETPDEWRSNTSHRITLSNNLIAEGLANATHAKGEHSKGTLIHDNATGILILRNLYVSNRNRNPFFKGGARGAVVNNVIVNPGTAAVHYHLVPSEWEGHEWLNGRMTVEGNVLRHGGDTRPGTALFFYDGPGDLELFLSDNLAFDADGQPTELFAADTEDGGEVLHSDKRLDWPSGLEKLDPASLEDALLETSGARPWDRDAVDERILRSVREGTTSLIDSEQEVGGYPGPEPTAAPFEPADWVFAATED